LDRICFNGSPEIINWYIEYLPITIIDKNNYKRLLESACKSQNPEVAKLIYNYIISSGIQISLYDLKEILYSLIYTDFYDKSDKIIYELINFGIKPPNGITKFSEYYNNINIIKNNIYHH